MKSGIVAVAIAILLGWIVPVSAQVKLEFNNGRVNLNAQNVPIRTILAEWSRLGGTRIVNGERLVGGPVTLELNGVTEQQAMRVLLSSAAGYIVGARPRGASGASAFASVLILPTSAAAAVRQTAVTPATASRTTRRVPEREPDPEPEEDPDEEVSAADRQVIEDAARRRVAERRAQIFVGDQVVEEQDSRPQPPAAASPFGLLPGAVRPGVITAPPPQSGNPRGRQPDPEPEGR